jgi:hypothetical protein
VPTITGIGAETGFLDFSLEQAKGKRANHNNPKKPMKII